VHEIKRQNDFGKQTRELNSGRYRKF